MNCAPPLAMAPLLGHSAPMCVVAIAWNAHPRWPIVLAGNRDEFHARAADPLHRWAEAPYLLGGRDGVAGGMWLGLSERGRLAVVTNVAGQGDPDPQRLSRGWLVRDWLDGAGGDDGPSPETTHDYNPFNLFTLGAAGLMRHSNRPHARAERLPAGVHSLSNGLIDTPWPRRAVLQDALARWCAEGGDNPEMLFAILASEVPPPDAPGETPVFIRSPVYGTRCSTLVVIDAAGSGWIMERRFAPDGSVAEVTRLAVRWPVLVPPGAGGGT